MAKSKSKSKSRSLAKAANAAGISISAAKLRLLKKLRCSLKFEKLAWAEGATLVAGVDEVGRGSLFGPVVAAAVILDPAHRIRGLRDSKLLPAERREELALLIRETRDLHGRSRRSIPRASIRSISITPRDSPCCALSNNCSRRPPIF